jgi:hypothetical protein
LLEWKRFGMCRLFLVVVALAVFVTSSAVGADVPRQDVAHSTKNRHKPNHHRRISGKLHRRRKATRHHRRVKHRRRVKEKATAKHPVIKQPAVLPAVPVPTLVLPSTLVSPGPIAPAPVLVPISPVPPRPPPSPPVAPPSKSSPLVGSSTLQAHTEIDNAGSAEAFEYVARAEGTVNSLSLYVASGGSAPSIVVGLYTNVSGHPGTLLRSATIDSPVAGAWNTVDVSPVTVEAGSIYWLAALAPSGKLALRDLASGGDPAQESRSSSLSALPSSWTSGKALENSPASFYASGITEVIPPSPPSPPPPQPPTASFTYTPASAVVGQPVKFDGTSSTCPDGSCTYAWSNDGGSTQQTPPLFPLGSGQTITLTFPSAGTEYVRLVVTDVLGQTATVEHDVTVVSEPPPPALRAPSNTAAPTVSGTAEVGQTLAASNGTWSGSAPIAYTYQWQRDGTTNIAGATSSTYKPVAGDVAHALDVLLTATNSAGKASIASKQTAAVIEAPTNGQQVNCIDVPSACGYPDATNTGVPAGTALTSKNEEMAVTTPGTTIKDLALNGTIDVDANNTTIEDSEIIVEGTQSGCSSPCGGKGIWIKEGVTGTVIQHVTCHGGAPTGANVTEFCIQNNDSSTQVKDVHFYNCTTCMVGPGTWSDNYVDQTGAEIPEEHYEDIYYGGGDGPLIVNHNTMLNPQGQTAVVFASVDFGDQTTLTITNNLMAGGGYMIYGGGSGNGGKVLGPVTVTGNRFSRKYYPEGGYYGADAYMTPAVTTWSGNIWDDTLKTVSE